MSAKPESPSKPPLPGEALGMVETRGLVGMIEAVEVERRVAGRTGFRHRD